MLNDAKPLASFAPLSWPAWRDSLVPLEALWVESVLLDPRRKHVSIFRLWMALGNVVDKVDQVVTQVQISGMMICVCSWVRIMNLILAFQHTKQLEPRESETWFILASCLKILKCKRNFPGKSAMRQFKSPRKKTDYTAIIAHDRLHSHHSSHSHSRVFVGVSCELSS